MHINDDPKLARQACEQALNGLPLHGLLAHLGFATIAVCLGQLSQAKNEFDIVRNLLAIAKEKHTVAKSLLDVLDIALIALDYPQEANIRIRAYEKPKGPIDERDMVEIIFEFLTLIAKRIDS